MRRQNSTTRPLRTVYSSGPASNGAEHRHDDPPAVDEAPSTAETLAAQRLVSPNREELGQVIDEFIQAAEEGEAGDGYGQYYTPAALRDLHSALSHVKSELGTMNIRAIQRWHVQGMLDELRGAGLAPGRLTAVVEGLHGVYSYAIERGLVEDSPVIFLTFPQPAARPFQPAEWFGQEERSAPPPPRRESKQRSEASATAPTPTQSMLALGGQVLLWTMRATITLFVLVAILLVVEFA